MTFAMDLSDGQTPHNRESTIVTRLGQGRRRFYSWRPSTSHVLSMIPCSDHRGSPNRRAKVWRGLIATSSTYHHLTSLACFGYFSATATAMPGILLSILICAGQGIFAITVSTISIWTMIPDHLSSESANP
ncbi:hypothetical protein B0O80DRAFT_427711 [Mortierella sp. GBAus27b]|nr:hypothetical protein B0O80DRAFT_427711 [Mortierella sp. GBAus27b]